MQANKALTGKQQQFEQVEDDSEDQGLKDGFEWYMNPQDKAKYEQIYQENRDMRGEVACKQIPIIDCASILTSPSPIFRRPLRIPRRS